MSNVAPAEVMCVTAKAFGLLPTAFRGTFNGNWAAANRPRALVARQAAVYLLLRHTTATHVEIGALFGLAGKDASTRFTDHATQIARELRRDGDLAARVAAAEDAIDAIHEERIAKVEAARAAHREQAPRRRAVA